MADTDEILDSIRGCYFDRQGQPMTLREWATAFEDFKGRLIARDKLDGCTVTTVWLGHDIEDGMPGQPEDYRPQIFGTLVATPADDDMGGSEVLSCTEDEARAAHAAALAELRARR